MDFLVRFAHVHESFRLAELEALAELHGAQLRVVDYRATSPFCIVTLPSVAVARAMASRAVLCMGIYELWARGASYDELHAALRPDCARRCEPYRHSSFKFSVDCFNGSISMDEQVRVVESFRFMDLQGPIRMKGASEEFTVFAEYELFAPEPWALALGRLVSAGGRDVAHRYSLKSRKYLSTTSMDSELAMIGANLALASPGKIVYDPFLGTGSLPLACAHFGAYAAGSDIDGRAIRGKGGLHVKSNFGQYGLQGRYVGSFIGDLTHSPLRCGRGGWIDAIVCDPPYGVREGLKVLGRKDGKGKEGVWINGEPAHLQDHYIPPKKPYSFERMLGDIMQFASDMLVDNGRLSFWMPTANDEEQELAVPSHPSLELKSDCVQVFNKWSRRLLTYRRMPGGRGASSSQVITVPLEGTADELNSFRKRYFQGFRRGVDGADSALSGQES